MRPGRALEQGRNRRRQNQIEQIGPMETETEEKSADENLVAAETKNKNHQR
jgi:hypothetical protein